MSVDDTASAGHKEEFSEFYRLIFQNSLDNQGNLIVETPQDIINCVAYALYQSQKKQFCEQHRYSLDSDAVRYWRESQQVEAYLVRAEDMIYPIIDEATEINIVDLIVEPITQHFNKATSFWRNMLYSTLSLFFTAFILYGLPPLLASQAANADKLQEELKELFTSIGDLLNADQAIDEYGAPTVE